MIRESTAAAAREAARRPSGQFGTQPRAEAPVGPDGVDLSPATAYPVFEVGDPSSASPGTVVRNYGKRDKVDPSTFGLTFQRDLDYPRVTGASSRVRIPLDRIVTDQSYVYEPHVRNLATVPAHILEEAPEGLPEVLEDGDRFILTHGNHRVTAALLRGDRDALVTVWSTDRPSPDTHDGRPVETLPAADFAAQFPPSLWAESWEALDELADEDVAQPVDEDEWEEMGAHFAWGGESGCTVEEIAESLAAGEPMHRPVEVISTEDGTWGVTDGHHCVVAALRVGAPIRFVRL